MKTVGIIFSAPITRLDPLKRTGEKRSVYVELLRKCEERGWIAVVLTKKTYQRNGKFLGYWKLKVDDSFETINSEITVDLVYDRTGGRSFPLKNDTLQVVDNFDFKHLAWDKWAQYQEVGEYMAKTVLVDKKEVKGSIEPLETDFIVMKPTNGLKGLGIYIGTKADALSFTFPYGEKYIAQEFVETKNGIPGITNGRHDLRVVIINGKPVWSHVRIPPEGEYKANTSGRNGGKLEEISILELPDSVLKIVQKVAKKFSEKYDSPVYSLDFGFDTNGKPWVFEINDQIGFPRQFMKAKDLFLMELIQNFKAKMSI
jgi:glutathione synthase/RimK-type ligase-like ATP-grasp enzyme